MIRVVNSKATHGKRVFLRVDFNVPFSNGKVVDDFRISASLPTIELLIKSKAKIILGTHLGEPHRFDPKLSTKRLLPKLRQLLDGQILWQPLKPFSNLQKAVQKLKGGQILLLENLRFEKGEILKDPLPGKLWASLAEIYVDDAFGTLHRRHDSIVVIPRYLPSYAGLLVAKEVKVLETVFAKHRRPLTFIMGGGKAASKLKLLRRILKEADYLLLGGVLANSILKLEGYSVGASKVDEEILQIIRKEKLRLNKIILPVDFSVSRRLAARAGYKYKQIEEIESEDLLLDIGRLSINRFLPIIRKSKIIVWNGPMGFYEVPSFRRGTEVLAWEVAKSKAFSIVGGGDLTAAVSHFPFVKKFNHISTGGGAMLEFLAGEKLPGLEALGYYK